MESPYSTRVSASLEPQLSADGMLPEKINKFSKMQLCVIQYRLVHVPWMAHGMGRCLFGRCSVRLRKPGPPSSVNCSEYSTPLRCMRNLNQGGREMTTKFIFVATIIATIWSCSTVFAADTDKSPSFLFSEDNQIVESPQELYSSISPRAIIQDDKWLNEPATRLDIVLLNINAKLNADLPSYVKFLFSDFLETETAPSVESDVRFYKGRLVISTEVYFHGKPKRPLKEFCERMLKEVSSFFPLTDLGSNALANNALGFLMRENLDVKAVTQKLAQSALFRVSVSGSNPREAFAFYLVDCMQQEADGPITFGKYSSGPMLK